MELREKIARTLHAHWQRNAKTSQIVSWEDSSAHLQGVFYGKADSLIEAKVVSTYTE